MPADTTVTVTPPPLPEGYVVQGGLTWTPIANNWKRTWSGANTLCTGTTINGQTGWRLPTWQELRGLYLSHQINVPVNGDYYLRTWSSTVGPNEDWHYFVMLGAGNVTYQLNTVIYLVTCVR